MDVAIGMAEVASMGMTVVQCQPVLVCWQQQPSASLWLACFPATPVSRLATYHWFFEGFAPGDEIHLRHGGIFFDNLEFSSVRRFRVLLFILHRI